MPAKVDFFKEEEKILRFWRKNKIFEKSIKQRSKNNPYSFYDGPPFVTGLPHYATLLPSIAKDVVPRYQTMKGKRVRRVWGWDCHGLPIENKVEEKLGLKNRREILKFGVNQFIAECRQYVEKVSPEWKWYIEHIGRWVDFDNAYRTMDLNYMETVIWVFKQLYDKGLIYQGNRVSLFCPRCSTPVSNFEIAMDDSYALMKDPAVTVKFKLKEGKFKNASVLAWTTTPWTLPSNRALVVDDQETYVLIQIKGEKDNLILAQKRLKASLAGKKHQLVDKFKGKKLLGLEYEPLYDFFPANKNDFKIYTYEGMVNMTEGTGVVHSAPGFGEIDTQMGKHYDLTLMFAVDDEGRLVTEVKPWAGVYVKDANPQIIENLKKRKLLFKKETITHRYPYCYRCQTPLIFKAQEAWFVDVQNLKKQLLKTNEAINWMPGHFKHGRFKKGIQAAPDWCLSRTRYWATIMPVWECQQCQFRKVAGSIKEIEDLSGQKVTDLHRPGVDHLVFKCEECGGVMKRVPEVLDCWMESGSMPYAQRHYPFENKREFGRSFPADFIVEYSGQVRAWFYVMHVVANALMKSPSFKNVLVTGVLAGTDGRKMSKSYNNYPDPRGMIKKHGGDALRLYLMGSAIMSGKDMSITKGDEIAEQVKTFLLPLWNSYRYFVTFANLHHWRPSTDKMTQSKKTLDRWILVRFNQLNQKLSQSMDAYQIPQATTLIKEFATDLSRWYIRCSRERFVEGDLQALATLYKVLIKFCLIMAPIVPFIAENIYRSLTGKESVHLQDWPQTGQVNKKLLAEMELVRQICELGHAARKKAKIKVRQPLKKLKIIYSFGMKNLKLKIGNKLLDLIKEELNIKEIEIQKGKGEIAVKLDTKITPKLKMEGEARELIRKIQELRKRKGCKPDENITVYAPDWPKEFEEYIKKKTLAKKILPGKCLKILTG